MKYLYLTLILATMNSFGQLVKVDYADGNQKLEGFFAKAQKANPKKQVLSFYQHGWVLMLMLKNQQNL